MMETVLLVPFVVVMVFFIYQGYTTTNRVSIVQKTLRQAVVGFLMNRYEVTAEQNSAPVFSPNFKTPTDGQYFYIYNEYGNGTIQGMNVGLDKSTTSILLTFMTDQGARTALETSLTDGKVSYQAMGICLGGRTSMKEQVSTSVFDMSEGQTCNER